jgi:hypothetical protein
MNKGELDYATRMALNHFDRWNDVTGVFGRGTGYYYEMQGIIEDCVKIAAKLACEGINVSISEITGELE